MAATWVSFFSCLGLLPLLASTSAFYCSHYTWYYKHLPNTIFRNSHITHFVLFLAYSLLFEFWDLEEKTSELKHYSMSHTENILEVFFKIFPLGKNLYLIWSRNFSYSRVGSWNRNNHHRKLVRGMKDSK